MVFLLLDDEQRRVGGERGFGFAEQACFGLFVDAEDVQAVGGGVELWRQGVEEAAVFGGGQPAVVEGLLAAGGVALEGAAYARLGAGVGDVVGNEVGDAVRHGFFSTAGFGRYLSQRCQVSAPKVSFACILRKVRRLLEFSKSSVRQPVVNWWQLFITRL